MCFAPLQHALLQHLKLQECSDVGAFFGGTMSRSIGKSFNLQMPLLFRPGDQISIRRSKFKGLLLFNGQRTCSRPWTEFAPGTCQDQHPCKGVQEWWRWGESARKHPEPSSSPRGNHFSPPGSFPKQDPGTSHQIFFPKDTREDFQSFRLVQESNDCLLVQLLVQTLQGEILWHLFELLVHDLCRFQFPRFHLELSPHLVICHWPYPMSLQFATHWQDFFHLVDMPFFRRLNHFVL